MDTTYWERNFGVVVIKDNISSKVVWHKLIDHKERLTDYKEEIDYLVANGFTIKGIVSDDLNGLVEMFPQYKFQLCQFHQIQTVRTKLTGHPKLPASIELLAIARAMHETDKESFIDAPDLWYDKWADFLAERSSNADGKTFYTINGLEALILA